LTKSLKKAEYIPVSPQILRPDTTITFGIFLRHDDDYVLFNAKGRSFTGDKHEELIKNDVTSIYIDKRERDFYRKYIQDHIVSLLDDESMPMEERAKAWTNSAAHLGMELFEEKLPGAAFKQRYQRFEKLVEKTASFLQTPKSLKHLSKFIGTGYEAYHHGISTMVYTVSLMQDFEYDEYDTLACGMGALLHDIGKSTVPKDITDKDPDGFTEDEEAIVALHPMVGVRTCASFNLPTIAANCILFHHERADGKGYPTQAISDEIPEYTKIVSLCNTYDNLTRNQPYRRAFKPFDALKMISEDEGLVDQDILKKFIEVLGKAEIA